MPLLRELKMGHPANAAADPLRRPGVWPAASAPNDEPPPRLRLRVAAVEMVPRPKVCAGNAAAAVT